MNDALVVVIGAMIGTLPGIYAILAAKRKTAADATQVLTDSAIKMMTPLQARIDKLDARVARLEEQNEELEAQVRRFRDLIRALWEGILILSKQLGDARIPLGWEVEQYRSIVQAALECDVTNGTLTGQ